MRRGPGVALAPGLFFANRGTLDSIKPSASRGLSAAPTPSNLQMPPVSDRFNRLSQAEMVALGLYIRGSETDVAKLAVAQARQHSPLGGAPEPDA